MSLFRAALLLTLCLALPLDLLAQGEAPPQGPPAPTDPYGDPLPKHVRLRLGTIRFRQGSPVASLRYSPDGKTLISSGNDQSLRMWEANSGKELFSFGGPEMLAGRFQGNMWVLSPDNKLLATFDNNAMVRLYDVATGTRLHQLGQAQNRGNNMFLSFSPDGKLFATIDNEQKNNQFYGVVRLWEVSTGKQIRTLEPPEPKKPNEQRFYPNSIVFSPDGKHLASNGFDGRRGDALQVWEVETAKALPVPGQPVEKANVGDLIAGLFDPNNVEFSNFMGSPTFSPDGKTLAGAIQYNRRGRGGVKLRLWDPISGKHLRDLGEHPNGINWFQFSPDGKTLAVLRGDQTVQLFNYTTGKELPAIGAGGNGAFGMAFSPNGKILALGGGDNVLRLFDAATAKELHALTGYQGSFGQMNLYQQNIGLGTSIAFAPDGKTVAGAGGGLIRIWDVTSGKELLPVPAGHSDAVHGVAASPDNKLLATIGEDQTVRLWDPFTAKELRQMEQPKPGEGEDVVAAVAVFPNGYAMGGSASSVTLRFSPDGKLLAGSWADGAVILWNVADGKVLHRLKGHDNGLSSIAFAPNGKFLATGGMDGRVLWWDIASGKQVRQFAGPIVGADDSGVAGIDVPVSVPGAATVALSPDGRTLATAGSTGQEFSIQLFEVSSGKLRRSITVKPTGPDEGNVPFIGFGGRAYFVNRGAGGPLTFSPDGKMIAWSSGGTTRLWDALRGKEIRQFGGQDGAVSLTAFSPDGKYLAASGSDGSVRIWDVQNGAVVNHLVGHRGSANTLTFFSDGRTLASSGADTSVLLWDFRGVVTDAAPPALSGKELTELWTHLASEDANRALESGLRLAQAPKETVAYLRERVAAAAVLDQTRIDKLLADLQDNRFAIRKRATDSLEKLGELAEPTLLKVLADNPPLEVKQRVEALLQKLKGPVTHPERLRALRSIEVLEQIGTPEAREVLAAVAQGAPEAQLTQDAKAALERLALTARK
jgi:WD40 repeat protein